RHEPAGDLHGKDLQQIRSGKRPPTPSRVPRAPDDVAVDVAARHRPGVTSSDRCELHLVAAPRPRAAAVARHQHVTGARAAGTALALARSRPAAARIEEAQVDDRLDPAVEPGARVGVTPLPRDAAVVRREDDAGGRLLGHLRPPARDEAATRVEELHGGERYLATEDALPRSAPVVRPPRGTGATVLDTPGGVAVQPVDELNADGVLRQL